MASASPTHIGGVDAAGGVNSKSNSKNSKNSTGNESASRTVKMPSLVVYDIYGGLVRQWNLQ